MSVRAGWLMAAAMVALAGCKPPPPGPDASPAEVAAACDAGDLDACARAARQRSSQYEAAMLVN
jgi:hypothetical protein